MAIFSISVTITTDKVRSTYKELKQKMLEKKTRAIIRSAKREPAEEG